MGQEQQAEDLGPCTWCGEPATTRLITKAARGYGKVRTPVCERHEQKFIGQGATSERAELDKKIKPAPSNWRRWK